MKTILITGHEGFIGKNLKVALEVLRYNLLLHGRNDSDLSLAEKVEISDFIFHLAGENRSNNIFDFEKNNSIFTQVLTKIVLKVQSQKNKKIPILFSSSIQVSNDSPYGLSKLQAEEYLSNPELVSFIYRLPGIFGKWSKPNYNSVVSTFCYNISRDLPVTISDPSTIVQLVYIDEVIKEFIQVLSSCHSQQSFVANFPTSYNITLKDLHESIMKIHMSRINCTYDYNLEGIMKHLYSTFLSFSPVNSITNSSKMSKDKRGVFSELIKFYGHGQISFFTAYPGVERGMHFHHSKNEKFFVVQGEAEFSIKSLETNETKIIHLSADNINTIESTPGWAHKIKNIGHENLIVVLWANEIFDSTRPDTYSHSL